LAVAAHAGVPLALEDWDRVGHGIALIADVEPSGRASAEEFHRAGGVAAVAHELLTVGLLDGGAPTITGRTLSENYADVGVIDHRIVRPYSDPLKNDAGFIVLRSNFFDSAIMKTSVIGADFMARYLSDPDRPGEFTARAVVFEGPEDYRARIDDDTLGVTAESILVIRNSGPIGYPGAPEVVNMTPPRSLLDQGIRMLPCLGDGRQSGTSDSPSILHVSPESAVGGGLSLIETGDKIRVSIPARRVDVMVSDTELDERRRRKGEIDIVESHTPWEELYRDHVTQLSEGAHFAFATKYRDVADVWPRHSH
jgi:dihydroxy-acid dehydratase